MLRRLKCPHCGGRMETDVSVGQTIPCPHCREAFEVHNEHVTGSGSNPLIDRLVIPLGYVAFVAVPMAGAIWFFTNQADKPKEKDAPGPVADVRPAPETDRDPPKPKRKGPLAPPRFPAPLPGPDGTPPPRVEDPPTPPVEVPPSRPEPPTAGVAVAPLPRLVEPDDAIAVEVETAPAPREVVWRFPPSTYTSDWQLRGSVEVRIAGVASTPVPITDPKGNVAPSPRPALVILVEVRKGAMTQLRNRELKALGQFTSLFAKDGKQLPELDVPPGARFRTGVPARQVVPQDRTSVFDVVAFATPPGNVGAVELRLESDRFGESGDLWFKIPDTAWKE